MPLPPARLSSVPLAVLAALACLAPARAAPAPWSAPAFADAVPDAAASLAEAQLRSARADAAVEALGRALTPGHLTDPMPGVDGASGLAALQAEYAALQIKAAGYRATLGDHHPTLAAAELMLADLRQQMVGATRRALALAGRDAQRARTDVAALERGLAQRPAAAAAPDEEVTGSIAAPPAPVRPAPVLAPPDVAPRPAEAAPPASAVPALALSLGLFAAGAGLVFGWRRRGAAAPPARRPTAAAPRVAPPIPARPEIRREPPPPAVAGVPPVPTAARLRMPSRGAAGVAAAFAAPGSFATEAGALHATLSLASAGDGTGRLTVLLARTADVPADEGDAAALALAFAAAAAGRRVALMEARPAGRLRRALLPLDAKPLLVEAGGTARTFYRLAAGAAVIAVLPSDAGEAEVARTASGQAGTPRLRGLDAFDTVVLVGERPGALAPAADLVLVVATPRTPPATLAAVVRPCRAAGRPCGTLLIETDADQGAGAPPRAAADPAPSGPAVRGAADVGLRGSFDPGARRAA